jgi:hypothetical protein
MGKGMNFEPRKDTGGQVLETDWEKMSSEKAVQLFEEWGFLVQPGPKTNEVTLILEEPTQRSYYVCETKKLPEMAEAVLRVRWTSGAIMARVRRGVEIRT